MSFLIPDFRAQSLAQLNKLTPDAVTLFENDEVDGKYTLVLRPEADAIKAVENICQTLRKIDDRQYFYPSEQLHMTLVGRFDPGVSLEEMFQTMTHAIEKRTLNFQLFGVGSNDLCSSVTAYPIGFDLADLRKKVRTAIGSQGDDFSSILPAYEKVGWINFMRYRTKPKPELLEYLRSQLDTDFGQVHIRSIELYKNHSRTLDPQRCTLLHAVSIFI